MIRELGNDVVVEALEGAAARKVVGNIGADPPPRFAQAHLDGLLEHEVVAVRRLVQVGVVAHG